MKWGINPFTLQAKPFQNTLKYIRRIALFTIATREHSYIIELCSTLGYVKWGYDNSKWGS